MTKILRLKCLFITLGLCLASASWADLSDYDYYQKSLPTIHKSQNKELKEALYDAIKNNKILSYKEARRVLFGELYLERKHGRYEIVDTYCEESFDSYDGVGPGRIPNHQEINCEHTWPQSRFNHRQSRSAQKSDLHHLFPSKAEANSARGNIPFGEVYGDPLSRCEASTRGDDIYTNRSAFEPPKTHKGNVARALFYFAVRYKTNIPTDEEVHLRKWHRLDPVDANEKKRHERIYQIQGNRNPFIDDPDLIDKVNDI